MKKYFGGVLDGMCKPLPVPRRPDGCTNFWAFGRRSVCSARSKNVQSVMCGDDRYVNIWFMHTAIDGGYSESWVEHCCSKTCGDDGTKIFTRTCTNPPPQHGGKLCEGPSEKTEPCNRFPCRKLLDCCCCCCWKLLWRLKLLVTYFMLVKNMNNPLHGFRHILQ